MVNSAERTAKGIYFALVTELLPFGQFDQFEDFLHLREGLAQRFGDLRHFIDRPADGRARKFRLWRGGGRFRPFGRGFRHIGRPGGGGKVHFRRFFRLGRHGGGPAATASPATTPVAARAVSFGRSGRVCFRLLFLRHEIKMAGAAKNATQIIA